MRYPFWHRKNYNTLIFSVLKNALENRDEVRKKDQSELSRLSQREQELLRILSLGYRYKEIADQLNISIETVRTHIRNIYEKLQVQSRTEAINKVFPRE